MEQLSEMYVVDIDLDRILTAKKGPSFHIFFVRMISDSPAHKAFSSISKISKTLLHLISEKTNL